MLDTEEAVDELSYLLGSWQVCHSCMYVDTDGSRTTPGHLCSVCGEPSKGGEMFFNTSVYLLVDLIKEAFTSEHNIENQGTIIEYELNTHYISVLLFFCTLRELLLNSLITDLCISQKIPENIYNRLVSDNKFHMQKQDKLFKSLTGDKWNIALTNIDQLHNQDCLSLNESIIKLVKLRNNFTHKGATWQVDKNIAFECISNIPPLINLYVHLNNTYVHSNDKKASND